MITHKKACPKPFYMLDLILRFILEPPGRIAYHIRQRSISRRHSEPHQNNVMADTPFILQEHQFQRLKNILARLCVECAARCVFLVDRDGQPIAFHGDIGDMDTTSFASLAAGNVAATSSMARTSSWWTPRS